MHPHPQHPPSPNRDDVRLAALIKDSQPREVFAVIYDRERAHQAAAVAAKWAGDPRLRFNWFDAAKLSRQIRDDLNDDPPAAG